MYYKILIKNNITIAVYEIRLNEQKNEHVTDHLVSAQ